MSFSGYAFKIFSRCKKNNYMREKLKYRIIYVICLIFAVCATNLKGQKNVNVDLFHGRMSMSIPIYNFKTKHLNLPITMDYSPVDILNQGVDYNKGWTGYGWGDYSLTGGIPTEVAYNPGWTGIGWNLNAGGVITRSVNVLPDERHADSYRNIPEGNFYAPEDQFYKLVPIGRIYVDSIKDYVYQYDTVSLGKPKDDTYEIGEDEFTFNFCGHTGTFFYYRGKWKVYSDEDIKVGRELDTDQSGTTYINKITLETADGTIYTFGGEYSSYGEAYGDAQPIEFMTPWVACGQTGEPRIAIAWFLSEIKSPEGDRIEFKYASGNDHLSPVTRQTTYSSRSKYLDPNSGNWYYRDNFSVVDKFPTDDQIRDLSVANTINSVFLSSISSTTSDVTIQFNRSTYNSINYPNESSSTKYKLDDIYISGSITKQFHFTYLGSSSEILKLTGLQESGSFPGGSTTTLPAYSFSYISATDNLAPEALNKITYPTGGYTSFEYESSYLDDRFRIKSYASKGSETDKSIITNYYYSTLEARKSDALESGVMATALESDQYPDQSATYFLDGYETIFELEKNNGYYCPDPDRLPWPFLKREEIGYSSVWEVQSQEDDNGTIIPLKKTNYSFHNYKDGYNCNFENKAGKLINCSEYDMSDNLIKSYSYEYEERPAEELERFFSNTYKFKYNSLICTTGVFGRYYTKSPRYLVSLENRYENGKTNIITYKYGSGNDRLVEQTVEGDKINYAITDEYGNHPLETTTTSYKYADEFNIPTEDGTIINFDYNTLHNQKNVPVETIVKKDGKIISGKFIKYKALATPERTYNYRPYQIYNLELSSPMAESDFVPSTKSWTMDSRYKVQTTFDKYDEACNVLEYHHTGGFPISCVYDDHYTQPIHEIKNCTNQELNNALSGSTDYMKLRTLLPKAQITSYSLNSMFGITSVTGPNGATISKEFDALGRLKCIKDNNGKILKTMEYNYNIQ